MAPYSGMSDYDIQLRQDYKNQQITAAREAKKADYLYAMSQQTATGSTSNSSTGNTSGTSSTASSSGSSTNTSSGTSGPKLSGSVWNSSTGRRSSNVHSGTSVTMPSYTSKLSGEDYAMRQEYYQKRSELPFVLPGVNPNVYLDALNSTGGQVPATSPGRGLGSSTAGTPKATHPQTGTPFAPTTAEIATEYYQNNPGSFACVR